MDVDLRRRLSAVVGEGAIDAEGVVHPSNLAQLHELLALGRVAGLRVRPLQPDGAAAPTVAAVVVDADRLGTVRLDASALLLHAGAGASWTEVRHTAEAAQLAVSSMGAVRQQSVGASVAAGEVAHRTVAGVDLLTPAGQLISSGGRTLRDVVGYDIAGLALGSGTQLGLIVAVALRLEPARGAAEPEPGPGPWRGDAGIAVVAAFGAD